MDAKEAIAKMKELVAEKRYTEARAIMEKIDHPLKDSWLLKLDTLIAKEKPSQPASSPTPASAKTRTAEQPAAAPASTRTAEQRPGQSGAKPASTTGELPVKTTSDSFPAFQDTTKSNPADDSLPNIGIIAGLMTIFIGGIIGGFLLYLSSKLVYMLYLSPLIAAAIFGSVMAYMLVSTDVRSKVAIAVFAALMGLVGYATYRFAEYQAFVQLLHNEIAQEYSDASTAEIDAYINELILEETGHRGFVGFLMYQASQGMSVQSMRTPMNKTYTPDATLRYWLIELVIMIGISGVSAVEVAKTLNQAERERAFRARAKSAL